MSRIEQVSTPQRSVPVDSGAIRARDAMARALTYLGPTFLVIDREP